ncbi:MAG: hypothetical protein GEEBNDBF_01543 [bacterium]|nr:hypothetical protein [bacterium]
MTPSGSHPTTPKLTGSLALTRKVVQGIAEAAAVQVPGVREAGPVPDPWRPVRQWLRLEDRDPAIAVDPEGTHLTIDVAVSVEYGTPIPVLVEKVRRAVARQVRETTGCGVEAVNVTVAEIARPQTHKGTRTRV